MKATHNKTGRTYYIDDVIIDTTNGLEPEEACKILYHNLQGEKFVREAHEFYEKFNIEEGFNVLSRACKGTVEAIKDYEYKKANAVAPAPVEEPKCSCSSGGPIILNEDCDDCMLEGTTECSNCYLEPDSCQEYDCSCESTAKPYIGELVDIDVYRTYKQMRSTKWHIDTDVVKHEAYQVLDKVFNKRCPFFQIEEKEYDNATSDYFLIGTTIVGDIIQVAKITKDCYEALKARVEMRI